MRKILVIGLGKFGRELIDSLSKTETEIIAVDQNLVLVNDVKDIVSYSAQLDSTDIAALREIGAETVDIAIVTIGENFESCILTVAVLRELGIKTIIVRAKNDREARILSIVGATQVIEVEKEVAKRLARTLFAPTIKDYIALAEGYSILQWEVSDKFIGKSLANCRFRADYGVNVVGIRRNIPQDIGAEKSDSTFELVPDASYVFEKGDILLIVGTEENLTKLTGIDLTQIKD
ncbi:MAG: TrkA family potassium uptake protein [Deltaproteobacteria bacterium]|nr:TrkA family potassium uptake protein [Deltaproteobacteria bacterium]